MTSFSETQTLRKFLPWVLISFSILFFIAILLIPRNAKDAFSGVLLGGLIGGIVGASVMTTLFRLDTRFDAEGVHYRLFPILGWRTITWADIQKATMISYPLGYGLRHVNEVYNAATRFNDNDGLRIQKINGRTILIGTHRPDELKAFLSSLPVEITA